MEAPIRFDGVWKSYPLFGGEPRTLRGMVARRAPSLARQGRRWALQDITLALRSGETTGVIGRNGAGKSTLLRLASGLGRPTRGRLAMPAHTASVLSLGDTFDMTLSGRENALTAMILTGARAHEARAAMSRILAFAELEQFADAPLRTYSDGMRLRLAFAVVAQLRPEALVIDEVLAVGDLAFQAKCMDHLDDLRAAGTAILFATHSLDQVTERCNQAVWLDGGRIRAFDSAEAVVGAYVEAIRQETVGRTPAPAGEQTGLRLRENRLGSQEITIERVRLADREGRAIDELRSGGSLQLTFELHPDASGAREAIVGVAIHRVADGLVCYDTTTEGDGVSLGRLSGVTRVALSFDRLDLLPGEYKMDIGVYRSDWTYAYDFHHQAYPLRVLGKGGDKGVFRPPHTWAIGPGA